MFEDENNRRIADLAGQVSMLKEVGQSGGTQEGGRAGGRTGAGAEQPAGLVDLRAAGGG